jgi:hypothetical protein
MAGSFYNSFSPAERRLRGTAEQEQLFSRLRRGAVCISCGTASGPIDLHAEDYRPEFYFDPRARIPVCYRCHMAVHCRLRYPAGFWAYQRELASGRCWPPLATRALGTVIAENLAPGRDVKGPIEREPDYIDLGGGLTYRFWLVPVLEMIGRGTLCPPGRVPGNSNRPTRVTPTTDLPPTLRAWKLVDVIAGVERESWIGLAERRLFLENLSGTAEGAPTHASVGMQLNMF